MTERWCIVGGAGFIGSHFVDALLDNSAVKRVTIFDNFSSGRTCHFEHHLRNSRLHVIRGDVKDMAKLEEAIGGHDVVIHLASNPDIARAVTDPDIDFREGTMLTRNVVEAMRATGVRQILYASGSGVYGELGETEATEDFGPLRPISTYGASKLAGEALITSYCYMFGFRGCAFRFGNVVGARQTHGVGFDFVRQLMTNPSQLRILGDGRQSKSYIHVDDVVNAVLLAHQKGVTGFEVYNVATGDYITVTEIAEIVLDTLGYRRGSTTFVYSGGNRGWKGDVPVVRLNTNRIRALGWTCRRRTADAIRASIEALVTEVQPAAAM